MSEAGEVTEGTLLGGRVRYRQLRGGHRTGIEPVLLAASIACQPGEHVLEGGTGAGAALLCLAARCPGVSGTGVERDGTLAALARENFRLNGLLPSPAGGRGRGESGGASAGSAAELTLDPLTPTLSREREREHLFEIFQADLLALPALARPVDHAFANPPWHGEASTASPDRLRDAAKRAETGLIGRWVGALAAPLRPGGSLTLIVPAASAADTLAALEPAGCGSPALLPLWPHAGEPARIVLIRGVRGGRGGCRVLPGLVLHDERGFTQQARAVLWEGAAIAL